MGLKKNLRGALNSKTVQKMDCFIPKGLANSNKGTQEDNLDKKAPH